MSGLKTGKPDDSEKDKISVNFYISGETFEKIDDVIYYVRKRLGDLQGPGMSARGHTGVREDTG